MLPRVKIYLTVIALLTSTLACSTIMREDFPETVVPTSIVTDIPQADEKIPVFAGAISCSMVTDRIMETISSGTNSGEEDPLDEEIKLVSYIISGDEISDPSFEDVNTDMQDEQSDFATHQRVWEYFSALIPADQRKMVAVYSVITDGEGGTLAAVSQIQSNANRWDLHVDIADTNDNYELTFTLVHEFGHLLTLEPGQVPPSIAVFNNPDDDDIYLEEVAACPQYFPGQGCANPDSYINAFYDQFWTDIYDEWNAINIEEDEDVYYEHLDAFYNKYQNQFVTDYAATSPEEDMAETFSFFVLGSQPGDNNIAEEKILFFYQYPKLVELRDQILSNLCGSFPE